MSEVDPPSSSSPNEGEDGTSVPSLKLHLHVHSACNLPKRDFLTRSSDPYVVFRWLTGSGYASSAELCRTRTVKQSCSPTWNERFEVELPWDVEEIRGATVPLPYLAVDLYDHDRISTDDSIGHFLVPIQRILKYHCHENLKLFAQWPLSDSSGPDSSSLLLSVWSDGSCAGMNLPSGIEQLKCSLADGTVCEFPGVDETLELFFKKCVVGISGHREVCSLYLTEYRLVLMSDDTQCFMQIPVGAISELKRNQIRGCTALTLTCRDVRQCNLIFDDADSTLSDQIFMMERRLSIHIRTAYVTPRSSQFSLRLVSPVRWNTTSLNWRAEFARQGIDRNHWRLFEGNRRYALCPTYPSVFYIPAALADDDVKRTAQYRSQGRIPALTYFHRPTGVCLVRCSQPSKGACPEDERFFSLIQRAMDHGDGEMLIIDARSRLAARGNRLFRGKGSEDAGKYSCRKLFMDLPNIYTVRQSFERLVELCTSTSVSEAIWLSSLEATGWLEYLRRLLSAAMTIVYHMDRKQHSVVVHCSDGWDRTSQLCALAQLLLDPYYRTIDGFRILVEKDWVAFGHRFSDRQRHNSAKRSPIFLQWIEAVAFVHQQCPSAFEFSMDLLIALADQSTSCWFGDFMFNSEKDRVETMVRHNPTLDETAVVDIESSQSPWLSFWDYIRASKTLFLNALYQPNAATAVLTPVVSIRLLSLWSQFYLRYDETAYQVQHHDYDNGIPEAAPLGDRRGVMWLPDNWSTVCMDCHTGFSVFKRRHHCRACGRLFCANCLSRSILLVDLGYGNSKQKVCDRCYYHRNDGEDDELDQPPPTASGSDDESGAMSEASSESSLSRRFSGWATDLFSKRKASAHTMTKRTSMRETPVTSQLRSLDTDPGVGETGDDSDKEDYISSTPTSPLHHERDPTGDSFDDSLPPS